MTEKNGTGLRWAGRIVAFGWMAFWTWFSIASGIGEWGELGLMGFLMHMILPALLLVVFGTTLVSDLIGALLLFVSAVAMVVVFTPSATTAAILVAPPVIAGALLLAAGAIRNRLV